MTLDEIDDILARLRRAAGRISDTLLELELDPVRRALDEAQLAGRSRSRWAAADRSLMQLWEWYSALDQVLDRAVEVRGGRTRISARQLAELTGLLTGESITFESHDVPLGHRDLLGASVTTLRCTPDELLDRMSAEFDEVKSVVAAVQTGWETIRPRLSDAGAALEAAIQRGRGLGAVVPADLAALQERLSGLAGRVSNDPAGVDGRELDEVDAAIDAFGRDVERVASLSRELPARIEAACILIDRVRESEREMRRARAELAVKIVSAVVPAPGPDADGLEEELDRVRELARRAAWCEAAEALDACARRAAIRLERAQRITAANRAPIGRRNQLRGLLDAYRGKARHVGRIEDPRLGALFAAAHDELYTAPTDLDRADVLVRRYQDALSGGSSGSEVLA